MEGSNWKVSIFRFFKSFKATIMKKHMAIIVDLDGTLAIFEGVRDGLDFSDVSKDKVNEPIRELVNRLKSLNIKIIILSGRPCTPDVYAQTVFWLEECNIPYDYVFLVDREGKPDEENKKYFYEKYIKPRFKIEFVLEDRNRVVKMWRELGLPCLQVAETDY